MLKSSHRMAKRFCSSALALLLLVPGSLLASAEETDSTDGAAGISNTGTQGEYFQYLSESGGKPTLATIYSCRSNRPSCPTQWPQCRIWIRMR